MHNLFWGGLIIVFSLLLSCNSSENNQEELSVSATTTEENLDSEAKDFLKYAARFLIFEIEMSRIAQSSGRQSKVKSFAAKSFTQNTRFYNELKKLSAEKHLLLPVEPDSSQIVMINDLKSSRRRVFDHTYLSAIIQNQTQAIILFEKASKSKYRSVKTFATDKTDDLKKQHLMSIQIYNRIPKY